MTNFLSQSVKQTHKLAKKILGELKGKNLICLYGPLGSGKTTFVQGLAKALGIKKRIISPTFILLREYKIKPYPLYPTPYTLFTHIDCYRLQNENDIRSIDLKETLSDKENLVIIEWAEKVKKVLPKERIDIKFEYLNENKRKISFIN